MTTILRQERIDVMMYEIRMRDMLEDMKKEKLKAL